MIKSTMTATMIEQDEWRWVFTITGALVILLLVPTVWAFASAEPGTVFTGVLTTPGQGAAYLAQIAQGERGSWLLTAPFTPEPHSGVFLVTFYLVLGHVARLLNLDSILLYHSIRLLGTIIMGLAVYRFTALWTEDIHQRRLAWGISVAGAGFGWLLVSLGETAPDVLGVPEAFPLQGAYATAHLPWMVGALAVIATMLPMALFDWQDRSPELSPYTVGLTLAAIIVASTVPHALLPVLIGLVPVLVWRTTKGHLTSQAIGWVVLVLVIVMPIMVYLRWAYTASDPVVAAWLAQSDPGMPPLWALLVALAPLLLLAGAGVWGVRLRFSEDDLFLTTWVIAAVVLAYAPIDHAYLFTLGVTLPLGVLAARGLKRVLLKPLPPPWRPIAQFVALALLLPSTALALLEPFTRQPRAATYLTQAEAETLQWAENNITPGAVMLASPELSPLIPQYGPHVVYAGLERQQAALTYFTEADCAILTEAHVDYVLVGPRERALSGADGCLPSTEPVYTSPDGSVEVYPVSR